jgi:hypothetical protein
VARERLKREIKMEIERVFGTLKSWINFKS